MSNLLTFTQQVAIKKISSNNSGKFDELCGEVEISELRDLTGMALLQDLQTNPTSTNNLLLLNGTTFLNQYSQTVSHRGIRFVLAYLNHSRYIGSSFAADTFTGMVRKNNGDSEPLSEGTIKRLQEESRKIALGEFELIRYYLDSNFTLFPLWISLNSIKPFTPRFESISKTAYHSKGELRCPTTGKRYTNW